MYDIVDSVLPMLMDVYKQFDKQDEATGILKKNGSSPELFLVAQKE